MREGEFLLAREKLAPGGFVGGDQGTYFWLESRLNCRPIVAVPI